MAYSMPSHGDPTNVMGRRIAAFLIDAVIVGAVLVAALALTKDHSYVNAPSGACQSLRDSGFSGQCAQIGSRVYTWKGGGFALAYLIAIVVSAANWVILQGNGGASVGKLILGLRVVDAQGQVCGYGRAFVRWLLLIVDGLCFGIPGLIVASVTHPHRRVGDMAGGTYVVGLADAGRPVVVAVAAYQYGYGQEYPAGWVPPGGATPGWGGPPGSQAAQPAWGAPPPPAQGWGQQPAAAPESAWGQPPAAAPTWGAPPPPPPPEAAPPGWVAPPPPPPPPAPPEPQPPAWGAPPLPPPDAAPPPPAAPPAWGEPPAAAPPPLPSRYPSPEAAPESAPPAWGAPPPAPTPPPPAPPAPPPAPPEPPPAPPPVPDVPPPPAAAPPPKPAPSSAPGESWWDKAFSDEEDEPGQ